jgi:predicted GIY-YIG superfamily endonuclease
MGLMMNSRQLGTLAYRLSFVESNPILIYEIFTKIRFVPFNIEENAEDNEIIYTGLCPEFDAIPEGEKPPKYSCASRFIGLALQEAIVKKSEAEKSEKAFKDVYRKCGGNCILKSSAKRFTKEEAMEFISKNLGRNLVIEDAV